MSERQLICIGCPLGCLLTVTLENGAVTAVQGNTCKRGVTYAEDKPVVVAALSELTKAGKYPDGLWK